MAGRHFNFLSEFRSKCGSGKRKLHTIRTVVVFNSLTVKKLDKKYTSELFECRFLGLVLQKLTSQLEGSSEEQS